MSRSTIRFGAALVFYAMSWAEPDHWTSFVWFAVALAWTFSALREARP